MTSSHLEYNLNSLPGYCITWHFPASPTPSPNPNLIATCPTPLPSMMQQEHFLWFLRSKELMIPAPVFHGAAPSACDTLLPDSHMAGSSPLSNRCSNITSLESHPMIVRTAPPQSSPSPSAALFYSEYWLLPTFIPVNLKMDFLYCYNTSLMKTGIFFSFLSTIAPPLHRRVTGP